MQTTETIVSPEKTQSGRPVLPGWMRRRIYVVPMLHVVNLLVFLGWNFFYGRWGEAFFPTHFTISAMHLKQGIWWPLITSAISHYSMLHYLVNTMVLHSFGVIMERYLGSSRFLLFYLGASVISGLSHCAASVFLPGEASLQALGASGALCGMMMLLAAVFPRSKFYVLALIPVPALVGVLLFVGLDLFGLMAQSRGGGLPIGHGAHLGGSLAGFIYFLYLKMTRFNT